LPGLQLELHSRLQIALPGGARWGTVVLLLR
jgi:hypothetical protein